MLSLPALLSNMLTVWPVPEYHRYIHSILAAATVSAKSWCTSHILPAFYAQRAHLSCDFTSSSRPCAAVPKSLTCADTSLLQKLHVQFAATVYDSIVGPTASTSLPVFRSACSKLWPRFIWPYISGEQPPGKAKSWDFARLLVRNRALFQTEAEQTLVERLHPVSGAWTFEELEAAAAAKAKTAIGIDSL